MPRSLGVMARSAPTSRREGHVSVESEGPPEGGAPESAELPAYHIASVGRALTLLEAFIGSPQLTVSEAAELLDVAPSTAHRLLQMLLLHHFVEQGDRRIYVRGPALASLGAATQRPRDVVSIVLPHLRSLRDELRGTAHLLALEGNGARFVTGLEWRDETRIASARVGWLLPAHTLAGGKSMLAQLSSSQVEALFPDGLPVTRYARISSLPQLQTELRDIRTRGYAQSGQAHENIRAIGMALPLPATFPLMAISVAWSDTRFPRGQEELIVERLRRAVQEIAAALAASPAIVPALSEPPQNSPAAEQ
jgi:IclR family acetate operon transcriptional repressor